MYKTKLDLKPQAKILPTNFDVHFCYLLQNIYEMLKSWHLTSSKKPINFVQTDIADRKVIPIKISDQIAP